MSDRLKLTLQISGFIVITLAIAWSIWLVFFRATPQQAPLPDDTGLLPGGLPANEEGFGGRVIDDETDDSSRTLRPETSQTGAQEPDTIASGGRVIADPITRDKADFVNLGASGFNYYDEVSGNFYTISPQGGEPVPLSNQRFPGVESVAWAQSGSKAVLEFPDGSNILYDFDNQKQISLPRAAQEFSFSPDENQIAYEYIGINEDDRWIVVSDDNGQGQRLVQPLGNQSGNVQVDWSPTKKIVATFREPTSSAGDEVFFIGLNGENFLSLQTNGLGFQSKWSPQGRQVLYSVYSKDSNYNNILHIAGADGDNIGANNRSLPLQTTPDKCAFASETVVYCAVPQFLEEGTGIFPELAADTPDTIYKVDLASNITSLLAIPESLERDSFTVKDIMVSEDQEQLYFTDNTTGRIHRIRLR